MPEQDAIKLLACRLWGEIGGTDSRCIEIVKTLIGALDAAGFAIVPKEPTEAMVGLCPEGAEMIVDQIRASWRAMLAAGAIKP